MGLQREVWQFCTRVHFCMTHLSLVPGQVSLVFGCGFWCGFCLFAWFFVCFLAQDSLVK